MVLIYRNSFLVTQTYLTRYVSPRTVGGFNSTLTVINKMLSVGGIGRVLSQQRS